MPHERQETLFPPFGQPPENWGIGFAGFSPSQVEAGGGGFYPVLGVGLLAEGCLISP